MGHQGGRKWQKGDRGGRRKSSGRGAEIFEEGGGNLGGEGGKSDRSGGEEHTILGY